MKKDSIAFEKDNITLIKDNVMFTEVMERSEKSNDIRAKEQEKLADFVHLSILYDFYGELLGEHKSKIFKDYVLNDLSLSEIADEARISRQGVHDIVKRCSVKLKEYEQKLHLAEKFEQTKIKVNEIMELSVQIKETPNNTDTYAIVADQIIKLSQEILNEL